ncbi:hypothetical protein CUJ83_12630 [Methanocella sp. CWC-04]|uniref:NADPH-dependent FMN reductase-like domain-containing protein n=1 Tax=Methanooceanicella nereidis TaxID=2052831 RepID=A0AAP2W895_9EURY|nr:NAD(P)H-dependent oxidoreductase [Methanocella sp. CWC-04]MCD1295841.1 hypothetical protein [Methanocella sp. CWC-04]
MKIAVMNGSPKGDNSITLQYIGYIKNMVKGHEFEVINVGHDIKKIENDTTLFLSIMEKIQNSDAVIWAFPVYHLSVPSQLKRFIELMFEHYRNGDLKDKYTTSITTSAHFFDNLAHEYMHSICEDLDMRYVAGFSADMMDLLKKEERDNMIKFAKNFLEHAENRLPVEKRYQPISYDTKEFMPAETSKIPAAKDHKIVLVTDAGENDTNLNRMIEIFLKSIPCNVEVVNINDADIRGGCLGCMKCAYDGTCVYKDDVTGIYKNIIFPADAMIYATKTRDRYFSSRLKMFFDRSFFNGHRPMAQNKQMGYIISGPLRQLNTLRQDLESRAMVGNTNLAGIVTDEYDDSVYLTSLIQNFSGQLIKSLDEQMNKPPMFPGVGGHKIFRDLVYSLSGIFREDDRFYKTNGLYDFPQKDIRGRAFNLALRWSLKIPFIKKELYNNMSRYMIERLKKIS